MSHEDISECFRTYMSKWFEKYYTVGTANINREQINTSNQRAVFEGRDCIVASARFDALRKLN